MALSNPFRWLSHAAQTRAFIGLFVLGAALMAAWSATDAPLRTAAAPRGILSLEFAGTVENVRRILDSWGPQARVDAGINLGLDFLFAIAYNGTIALACVLVAQKMSGIGWLVTLGFLLAWAQLAGLAADSTENYALIQLLRGAEAAWLPPLARTAATIKGALGTAGIVYAVGGAILVILARFFPRLAARITAARGRVAATPRVKAR